MASRTRSCDVASDIGLRSEKLRRSPLTEYWRAGNVTFLPLPVLRSHTPNPISFSPSPPPSCTSICASGRFPGGLLFSFGTFLFVIVLVPPCTAAAVPPRDEKVRSPPQSEQQPSELQPHL